MSKIGEASVRSSALIEAHPGKRWQQSYTARGRFSLYPTAPYRPENPAPQPQ
jgi:hypothetical protein